METTALLFCSMQSAGCKGNQTLGQTVMLSGPVGSSLKNKLTGSAINVILAQDAEAWSSH